MRFWVPAGLLFLVIFVLADAGLAMAQDVGSDDGGKKLSRSTEARKPTDYYYDLLMSENDSVCKPLTQLYNRLLKEMTKKLVVPTDEEWKTRTGAAKQYMSGRVPYLTFFEISRPEEFEKIGFIEPPVFDPDDERGDGFIGSERVHGKNLCCHYTAKDYSGKLFVDLFGDGHRRLVLWGDREATPGFDNIRTEFIFFKSGMKSVDYDGYLDHVNPALAEYFNVPGGLPENREDFRLFDLTKMPHFELLERKYGGHPEEPFGKYDPVVSSSVTARIFEFHGRTYFVANQHASMLATKHIEGSNIVVYRMKPSGRDDVCYIGLAPSAIASIVKGRRYD